MSFKQTSDENNNNNNNITSNRMLRQTSWRPIHSGLVRESYFVKRKKRRK